MIIDHQRINNVHCPFGLQRTSLHHQLTGSLTDPFSESSRAIYAFERVRRVAECWILWRSTATQKKKREETISERNSGLFHLSFFSCNRSVTACHCVQRTRPALNFRMELSSFDFDAFTAHPDLQLGLEINVSPDQTRIIPPWEILLASSSALLWFSETL